MAGQSVEECFALHFNRFTGRPEFGMALAASKSLPQPLVDQSIALTALRTRQPQAAVIKFNGGHGTVNSKLRRSGDQHRSDLDR